MQSAQTSYATCAVSTATLPGTAPTKAKHQAAAAAQALALPVLQLQLRSQLTQLSFSSKYQ